MNRSFAPCSKPRPRCGADSPRRFPIMNGKTRRPGNRSARPIMVEHDRRTALGLVAGAGLASALILPACAPSSNSNESSNEKGDGGEGEVTANEDLMSEHGRVRTLQHVYHQHEPKPVEK